jgi:hypothetical protein
MALAIMGYPRICSSSLWRVFFLDTAAIPGFANAGSTGRHQWCCFAIGLDFSFIGSSNVLSQPAWA